MARYFFHLRDHRDQVLDPEGLERPGMEAIQERALWAARDTLSHDLRDGRLDLRYRIDVENEDGEIVHSLALEQAFDVIRA